MVLFSYIILERLLNVQGTVTEVERFSGGLFHCGIYFITKLIIIFRGIRSCLQGEMGFKGCYIKSGHR